MKKSTSKWGNATPYTMPDVIPFSDAPAKSAGKKMASDTRQWTKKNAASQTDAGPVTKPNLPNLPAGGTKSHPSIYKRVEPAPKTYGPNSPLLKAPKTGEAGTDGSGLRGSSMGADSSMKMPKKWWSKNYDLNTPSDLSGAPRLKKKWSKA